jgi:hypothetical protein
MRIFEMPDISNPFALSRQGIQLARTAHQDPDNAPLLRWMGHKLVREAIALIRNLPDRRLP